MLIAVQCEKLFFFFFFSGYVECFLPELVLMGVGQLGGLDSLPCNVGCHTGAGSVVRPSFRAAHGGVRG